MHIYPQGSSVSVTHLSRVLSVVSLLIQGVLALGVSASILFLATLPAGWWSGYALPNTAIFRWWPTLTHLALYEPFAGHALLAVALVGLAASWLEATAAPHGHVVAAIEHRLVGGFRRFGLLGILALFLFSVGATWAGIPRPQDLSGNAVAGLLPFSDANGHFEQAYHQAISGTWQPFISRRPLAAAFRAVTLALVDFNNYHYLLLQAAALALSTFFATRSVMAWRGLWAGLTFLGLTCLLQRPYLPTNLTEPLGLFWALASVPFLVKALRFNHVSDAAVGLHLTIWALMTRMGAMFTAPALALWVVIARDSRPGALARRLVLTASLFLVNTALVSGLFMLYGSPGGAVGSNFSETICGLTHGTDWTGCFRIYAEELKPRKSERERATLFYGKARAKLQADPGIFFARLAEGEVHFVKSIGRRTLTGHHGTIPSTFPVWLWWWVAIGGMVRVLGFKAERDERAFWLLFVTGLAASVPFVMFDDGWRVLCASFVLLAVLLASGFASPLHHAATTPGPRPVTSPPITWGLLTLVAVSCVVAPHVVYTYDFLNRRSFPDLPLGPDEAVVLGTRHMSGVLVMPDGHLLPRQVPAIHESDFIRIVRQSGIEQYQPLVTPQPVHQPPYAIVSAIRVPPNGSGLLVLPAHVFSTMNDRLWRLTLQPSRGKYWVTVVGASPVP
jgi:hypothetical protein